MFAAVVLIFKLNFLQNEFAKGVFIFELDTFLNSIRALFWRFEFKNGVFNGICSGFLNF